MLDSNISDYDINDILSDIINDEQLPKPVESLIDRLGKSVIWLIKTKNIDLYEACYFTIELYKRRLLYSKYLQLMRKFWKTNFYYTKWEWSVRINNDSIHRTKPCSIEDYFKNWDVRRHSIYERITKVEELWIFWKLECGIGIIISIWDEKFRVCWITSNWMIRVRSWKNNSPSKISKFDERFVLEFLNK